MATDSVGVGLLGCGVVGSAVAERLAERSAGRASLEVVRVAVRDLTKVRRYAPPGRCLTDDVIEVVEERAVDVVVEVIGGVDVARIAVERAFSLGKPVVTANKALLGQHGPELRDLAAGCGVPLLYEGAVGAVVPVVRAIEMLRADRIVRITGVLNGTTNFVLCEMERGCPMPAALDRAREHGFAEADAARDLSGQDAADKLALLAQVAFEADVRTYDVDTWGIDWLTPADIARAARAGKRWRLVATATRDACSRVEPQALPVDHPLARVIGAANAVVVETARSGAVVLSGLGAGGDPTATAVVADTFLAASLWCRRSVTPGAVRRSIRTPW